MTSAKNAPKGVGAGFIASRPLFFPPLAAAQAPKQNQTASEIATARP